MVLKMTFIVNQSSVKIKEVKPGDSLWYINTGLMRTPRAGFEVNSQCPKEYRMILRECINNGWLKPVAYMRDNEYAWESLKE